LIFQFEIDLINSELVKEAFDETSYEILKKIIIPQFQIQVNYQLFQAGILQDQQMGIYHQDLDIVHSIMKCTGE